MAIVKTDSQHYSDIAAAIRSKNGGTGHYTPSQMPEAILNLETGGAGSAIVVYAPTGSVITVSMGDITRTTAENNGVWRFEDCTPGVWTVNAGKDGMTRVNTVEIQEQNQLLRYEVYVTYATVLGISRDITSSSPVWTRTDSAVGLTATGSVGTTAGASGYDDFYPWNGIHRETLSTGDVMVKIPKFWYRRYREGNVEHLKIADLGAPGFKLHPAFIRNGVERDAIYVGAYMTSASHKSQSGLKPSGNLPQSTYRTQAKNKGPGWGILDIFAVSAIQILFLVEFATNHVQGVLGRGYVSVGEYSGDCVNTGTTDSVANLTGRAAGTDGSADVVWRGIESIWGNVAHFVDGLLVDCTNKQYYICQDPSSYADALNGSYTAVSFPIPGANMSKKYITELGLDSENDHLLLPAAAGSGSATTYFTDIYSASDSGVRVVRHGGGWYNYDMAGIFTVEGVLNAAGKAYHTGSRLLYIP